MFSRCLDDGEYRQAIGLALDCARLDIVQRTIAVAPAVEAKQQLLQYTLDLAMDVVQNLEFRNRILSTLVKLYHELSQPDYFAVSRCLLWLGDHAELTRVLVGLAGGSDEDRLLIAYQIAFDTYEHGTQDFLTRLSRALGEHQSQESSPVASGNLTNIISIVNGTHSIKLHLEFLFRNNNTDKLILTNILKSVDSRNSMYHTALTFANGFMNAGTTSDQFLRENMDWLARAGLWTKFSATAQLGVVHKGNLANSKNLLSPYLPQEATSVSSSPYVEGGALYALGLIHANHGGESLAYLKDKLKNQDEVVQHGACLGIGAAAMALEDESLYEALKNILFADSAVAGEAASLAMGLVMLGSGSAKAIGELLQYAHETQHEKIIRGIAVAIALIVYGRRESADSVIEQLLTDKDALLRYSGAHAIALAYVGTSSNKAIKKLLHIAVSDANDDVRRAAVSAIGFVLVNNPKQVPRVVQLLAESYNPQVRYGAAMALGVSCAGTGLEEALELLEPLTKDSSDFVRQGAFLAAAMILIQYNDSNAHSVKYRELFAKVLSTKNEESLARFGAILATGIINAGGRNVTIGLIRDGHIKMEAVVGMILFQQFWWWFPLSHFLSLSFVPTSIVGLNKDLKMPKFEFESKAKPSKFAYPALVKPKTDDKVEKVATAILSTTAKAKARAKKAEKEKGNAMDTDEPAPKSPVKSPLSPSKKTGAVPKEEEPKKKVEEPAFETLQNMARVMPCQTSVISFLATARYQPIKKHCASGVLLLKDTKPGEPEEIIEFSTPAVTAAEEEKEAEPPQPFEYIEA